jgi:hypothetical protein
MARHRRAMGCNPKLQSSVSPAGISWLWGTKPVKTHGVIGPLWIVEISGAIGQHIRRQGLPNGIRQVGTPLNHHDEIGRAEDVEAKLIGIESRVK